MWVSHSRSISGIAKVVVGVGRLSRSSCRRPNKSTWRYYPLILPSRDQQFCLLDGLGCKSLGISRFAHRSCHSCDSILLTSYCTTDCHRLASFQVLRILTTHSIAKMSALMSTWTLHRKGSGWMISKCRRAHHDQEQPSESPKGSTGGNETIGDQIRANEWSPAQSEKDPLEQKSRFD